MSEWQSIGAVAERVLAGFEQAREGEASQVAKQDEPQRALVATAAMTPMEMLDRAVSQGKPVEVLEKLMALQERWEANQARKAFDAALAAAKAEIPPIKKNRHVSFESKKPGTAGTSYFHEDLGEIARTVDPILGKHGLSYRWRTTSAINEPITVTCVLSHRDGHFEQNTLSAGRDDSGSKNSIQQIGSTITYLQRYTLKAAIGLAAANDDDARSSGEPDNEYVSEEQVAALTKLITGTGGDVAKFCAFAKVGSLSEIYANRYDAAVATINNIAETRKQRAAS